MGIMFSDTSTNTGILQRARKMARVDATQWETANIVNSCNDWLNKIFTYGKGADHRFEIDDTNHTKLPIGTTDLVAGQEDYSFLTDEQGNRITNLTAVSLLEIATNNETPLYPVDRKQYNGFRFWGSSFGITAGTPRSYDKIADNVIKLDYAPTAADVAKYSLKYYFQRSPSYFAATDTTKQPGVADDLHRGFVIASAYDAAFTLGLANLQPLSVELAKEEQKLEDYFATRETDEPLVLTTRYKNPR